MISLVSAPSDGNRVYMAGVGKTNIYRSDNQGDTWTITALTGEKKLPKKEKKDKSVRGYKRGRVLRGQTLTVTGVTLFY